MNNLVIGNTSQLSHYFPKNYEFISSRNIDFKLYKKKKHNKIFITFAEQRTYIGDDLELFTKTNVDYTLKIIDFFKDKCNIIIWYSTIELWNNCEGQITINTPFNYNYTSYIKSKEIITNILKEKYSNKVIIIYPVNFNSIYRKGDYLFAKIISSLLNNKKIKIGDINFKRDILHPKFIVNGSLYATKSKIIGSGQLINIRNFVIELYDSMGMNFNDYVKENINNNLSTKRKTFYTDSSKINIQKIIDITVDEIKKNKFSQ
jgi:nucleoside-diphosphate-sugar epimerase